LGIERGGMDREGWEVEKRDGNGEIGRERGERKGERGQGKGKKGSTWIFVEAPAEFLVTPLDVRFAAE